MGSQQRRTWWASVFGIGMLLLACGCVAGVGAWLVVPFTPAYANYIPEVRGKLELLAPAERRPSGAMLSPGGRYILVTWQGDGASEGVIWDRETDVQLPRSPSSTGILWLDDEQYIMLDEKNNYYVVEAHNGVETPATRASEWWKRPTYEDLAPFQVRWHHASQVYLVYGLGYAGPAILTVEAGKPYVYLLDLTQQQQSDVLQDLKRAIPNKVVEISSRYIFEGDRIPSPAHLWYAQTVRGEVTHLRIMDASGAVLAEVGKPGWYPALLGWAHDGSGVYVQFGAQGEAAAITMPYRPIFKLSPFTPDEARQAQLQRIAWWAGGSAAGVGVLGGVVWWRKRATRKRRVP